jgi:hypothetical protein
MIPSSALFGPRVRVHLTDRTIRTSYFIGADGTVRKAAGNPVLENWLSRPSLAANYEVRATYQSGEVPSGTLGTWLSCNTDRTWTVSSTLGVILVEIRSASTGAVLTSATINLTSPDPGGGPGGP